MYLAGSDGRRCQWTPRFGTVSCPVRVPRSCGPSRRPRLPRSCAGNSGSASATKTFCSARRCLPIRWTRCWPPGRRRGTTTPTSRASSTCCAGCAARRLCRAWSSPNRAWSWNFAVAVIPGAPMPASAQGPGGVLGAGVAERLRTAHGFVFDLDGTLVLGDRRNHRLAPLPGALDITRWLTQRRVPFVVLTNGTTRPPRHYAQMLRHMGFGIGDDAVVTPASRAVWAGAALYSSSQSVFFASADGKALGTSRAISAMIKSVTGCRIQVVGKPSLHALRCAAGRLSVPLKDIAVVGDDPDLEVPMAHRGRALAIAVTTGVGGADSFDHLPAAHAPHLTVHGVDELLVICRRLGIRAR